MARIDEFFRYLVSTKGSDLHLSEGQPPKIRVHGAVTPIPDQGVLSGDDFKNLLGEICDPAAFERYLKAGDLDFAYEMDENSRCPHHCAVLRNGMPPPERRCESGW